MHLFSQITQKLSDTLGRKIEHVKLDEEARYNGLVQAGVSEYFARFLTNLELLASQGHEDTMNDTVREITGHQPKSFATFAEANKAIWSP